MVPSCLYYRRAVVFAKTTHYTSGGLLDRPDHRALVLGTEVLVRSPEERDALLKRVAELEGLAAQGRSVPELLSRLDVSERRFSQVRRLLERATATIAEASLNACTDLEIKEPTPRGKEAPHGP